MKKFCEALSYHFYRINRKYFHLPIPLRNHFYKWRRIDFWGSAYCYDCLAFINLRPLPKMACDLKCPKCGGMDIVISTELFKAKVDKKSNEEIVRARKEFDEMRARAHKRQAIIMGNENN